MIQVTRGDIVALEPLDTVIRDPRQNVPLKAGDVVTALFQPYSFTAFGATGKNEEINFEAQGITLAQALARAGGGCKTRGRMRRACSSSGWRIARLSRGLVSQCVRRSTAKSRSFTTSI